MWTINEDFTKRDDPACPSKTLRSLPVPFLGDLNKKCRTLKKYKFSWREKLEKIRESSLCLPQGKGNAFLLYIHL